MSIRDISTQDLLDELIIRGKRFDPQFKLVYLQDGDTLEIRSNLPSEVDNIIIVVHRATELGGAGNGSKS